MGIIACALLPVLTFRGQYYRLNMDRKREGDDETQRNPLQPSVPVVGEGENDVKYIRFASLQDSYEGVIRSSVDEA
jgi:hypothetical protein